LENSVTLGFVYEARDEDFCLNDWGHIFGGLLLAAARRTDWMAEMLLPGKWKMLPHPRQGEQSF
jgi:hypothetical protein